MSVNALDSRECFLSLNSCEWKHIYSICSEPKLVLFLVFWFLISVAQAISRRAVLHEMIRDYGQAASDLQKLISILDVQPSDKAKESGTSGRSAGSVKDLRQAQTHLLIMEEEAKIGISLNFYLIL